MDKLTVFAKIKGVGSASGLFWKEGLLYIIGDNSAHLYQYNLTSQILNRIQVLSNQNVLENIPKATKPDFEVLCNYQQTLYMIGSGSTPERNLMIEYHLETKEIVRHNLADLYAKIKTTCSIDKDNLNIEGAIFTGNDWFLFNRGNGNAKKNGIIKIYGSTLAAANKMEFTSLVLLKTNNLVASFTDAVLHHNQIYFLAAAEDTTSTYDDGKILGSYIGSVDVNTLNLNFTKKISTHQKFEGITFLREVQGRIEFLICEDTDTEGQETLIYKLTV